MPVRVSPDGRRIAFGDGNTMKYVDFWSDKVAASRELDASVRSLNWDPEGRILYATTVGGQLVRLDSEQLGLEPQAQPINSLRGGALDLAWQRLGVTIAPTPAVVGTAASVAFDGSALLPGTKFTCSLTYTPPAPCTSPYQATGLATGDNLMTIAATEPDGRVTKAYRILTADASGPLARMTGPAYQSAVAATAKITVAATDQPGSRRTTGDIGGPRSPGRTARTSSRGRTRPRPRWTSRLRRVTSTALRSGRRTSSGTSGPGAPSGVSPPLDDRSMTMATTGWARGRRRSSTSGPNADHGVR